MKELILSHEDAVKHTLSLNAQEIGNGCKEIREGREYTKHSYLCPIHPLTRVIKFIEALAITVFTAFFALFLPDVRNLWSESFSGQELLVILTDDISSSFNKIPDDMWNLILKETDIKTIGRLASVSKKFEKIQKNPLIWHEIAKSQDIVLDPNNIDVKGQVRDAKIKLDLGWVDRGAKTITWDVEGTWQQREAFFLKAVSLFGINHYAEEYIGFGSTRYYYCDSDGLTKDVRNAGRMDDFRDDRMEREKMREIADTMTKVAVEKTWENREIEMVD